LLVAVNTISTLKEGFLLVNFLTKRKNILDYSNLAILKTIFMEKQGAKQVVSIRVSPHIYRQLKSEVGKGRISAFIERLITRELKEQKKNLAQECQAASQDKKRLKEAQA